MDSEWSNAPLLREHGMVYFCCTFALLDFLALRHRRDAHSVRPFGRCGVPGDLQAGETESVDRRCANCLCKWSLHKVHPNPEPNTLHNPDSPAMPTSAAQAAAPQVATCSTHRYLKDGLQLDVGCTSTGVKHLHHRAVEYDIGIYFEVSCSPRPSCPLPPRLPSPSCRPRPLTPLALLPALPHKPVPALPLRAWSPARTAPPDVAHLPFEPPEQCIDSPRLAVE